MSLAFPLRTLGLLLLAGLVIASVGYLASSGDRDRSYGPLSTATEAPPPGLGWNVSPIPAPDRMPVYRLEESHHSGPQAVRIAEDLGMRPDGVSYDVSQRVYIVQDSSRAATLTVQERGSQVTYKLATDLGNREQAPELPSDTQARVQAREILDEAGLSPPQDQVERPARVSIGETFARCESAEDDNASQPTCRQVNLTKSVRFERRIDGFGVLGGGELHLVLGSDARLVRLEANREPIRPAGSEATISFEQALNRAQATDGALVETRPGACPSQEIDRVRLSYYVPPRDAVASAWGPQGPWVFPAYTFEASCEQPEADASDWSVRISVPAVR